MVSGQDPLVRKYGDQPRRHTPLLSMMYHCKRPVTPTVSGSPNHDHGSRGPVLFDGYTTMCTGGTGPPWAGKREP